MLNNDTKSLKWMLGLQAIASKKKLLTSAKELFTVVLEFLN